MKKVILAMVLVLTASLSAMAMSKSRSRQEASFLTDKMALELHLTPNQMQDVYEINYDYFRTLGSVFVSYEKEYHLWLTDLSYVFSAWQWRQFQRLSYFLTPVQVVNRAWYFPIYTRYTKGVNYYSVPVGYKTYVGGHHNSASYYQTRSQMHRQEVQAHSGIHATDRPNVVTHSVNGVGNNHQNVNGVQPNRGNVSSGSQRKVMDKKTDTQKPRNSRSDMHGQSVVRSNGNGNANGRRK